MHPTYAERSAPEQLTAATSATARIFKQKSAETQALPFLGGAGITWANGVPVPTIQKQNLSKDQINALLFTAASLPYIGVYDTQQETFVAEDRFRGLTCAEVVAIRLAEAAAQGSLKAIEMLLDRTVGKPKQQIEAVSMKMSYTEFLEHLAREERGPGVPTSETTAAADSSQDIEVLAHPSEPSPPPSSLLPAYQEDILEAVTDPFLRQLIASEEEERANDADATEYEF